MKADPMENGASATPASGTAAQGLQALLAMLQAQKADEPAIVDATRVLLEALTPDASGPFLSVIVRTQGRRPEALRDVLLCLAGQSCRDFELLVMAHNASAEAFALVSGIVEDYRGLLPGGVRLIPVEGGGRARPLNVALDHARGQHFVALDDDDLVFAHWVESFRQAAESSRGALLRSVTAVQSVESVPWAGDREGFRASSLPQPDYDPTFDLAAHFSVNHSPFMSVAFPRTVVSLLGLRFDEELAVLEDWDLILRTATVLGVVEVPELTSIYRQWPTGETSVTLHTDDEWEEARAAIISRIDAMPVVLPPGTVSRLREMVKDENAAYQLNALFSRRSWKLLRLTRRVLTPVIVPARWAVHASRRLRRRLR